MVDLAALFRESDVVSLHVPLTEETRHIVDEAALSEIKSSAYLINTSRGGLIDHDALRSALEDGRLAGAALDVYEPEPPDLGDPLFQHERVIATPHAAFVSVEALVDLRTRVARQIAAVLSGGPSGSHKIEGTGAGFVVPLWTDTIADEIQTVSTQQAMETARLIAREEGIFAGTSTGANVTAALRVADRLGSGKTVVTVACDSGMKYLSTELYSDK